MKRRQFLIQSSLCAGSSLIAIGTDGWAARSIAGTDPNPHRLVVVILRGAIDGLSVVVPYQEPTYYTDRPTIAIPQPGQTNGVWLSTDNSGYIPPWHPYSRSGNKKVSPSFMLAVPMMKPDPILKLKIISKVVPLESKPPMMVG